MRYMFGKTSLASSVFVDLSVLTKYSLNLHATCADAEHPDMVQEFVSKTQNSRSVMLEWKPPRKPGVFHYKVSAFAQ